MAVMLRVDGRGVDVDACRAWLPRTGLERVWRAGEQARTGAAIATSGFSFLLSDAEGTEMVPEAVKAFLNIAHHIDDLVSSGANAEIDFGIFVDAQRPSTLAIEPDLLSKIGRHRVALVVTAYPIREDEK